MSDSNLEGQLEALRYKIKDKRKQIARLDREFQQGTYGGTHADYVRVSTLQNEDLVALEDDHRDKAERLEKQKKSKKGNLEDFFSNPEPHFEDGEMQLKVPIDQMDKVVQKYTNMGYDVGTDGYYEDPNNYVTVIVRQQSNPKKRLAVLTPQEDAIWENAFLFYLDEGSSDAKADKNAWRDLKLEFPRLKAFDGIDEKATRKALTNPDRLAEAHALGTKAFNEGKSRVPILDQDLMNMIHKDKPVGKSDTLPIIKEWLKAWDIANLRNNPHYDDTDAEIWYGVNISDLMGIPNIEIMGNMFLPPRDQGYIVTKGHNIDSQWVYWKIPKEQADDIDGILKMKCSWIRTDFTDRQPRENPELNPLLKKFDVITAPDGKQYQVYVNKYSSGWDSGEGEHETSYPYAVKIRFVEQYNDRGNEILEEWTTMAHESDAIAEAVRLNKSIKETGLPWQIQNNPDEKHIVALSGGKDSSAMLLRMLELGMKVDKVIFADTGKEFKGIYAMVDKMDKYLQANYGLKVDRLVPEATFDEWFYGETTRGKCKGQMRGFPLFLFPCYWSREAKFKQMDPICRDHQRYIGIASDEPKRLHWKKGYNYPLADWGWTEADALNYLKQRGFDEPVHSEFDRTGCYLCIKQNKKSLRTVYEKYPEHWAEMKKYERDSPHGFRPDFTLSDIENQPAITGSTYQPCEDVVGSADVCLTRRMSHPAPPTSRNPDLPPKKRIDITGKSDFPQEYEVEMPSDSSDRTYMVRKKGDNWTCTCPSFIFSKKTPRTCKHILRVIESGYEPPIYTQNDWDQLSTTKKVSIIRQVFSSMGSDSVIALANTKWDNIPVPKQEALSPALRQNPDSFKLDKNLIDRRIEITLDGKIYLDGKEISLEKYREYLKNRNKTNPDYSYSYVQDYAPQYIEENGVHYMWIRAYPTKEAVENIYNMYIHDLPNYKVIIKEYPHPFRLEEIVYVLYGERETMRPTTRTEDMRKRQNPGYLLPKTHAGTIEDLMVHKIAVEHAIEHPYQVDKEMGRNAMSLRKNPIPAKQRSPLMPTPPDPKTFEEVKERLMSPEPQNFSIRRVIEGQESQNILEAIAMDLYGGIPLIGDANDLGRTTRIIKTSGSPLKAQIHSIDTLLGTEGIPLVDMIPVIGGTLSKVGGEIADFLLPANTIGFIIEKPTKSNPEYDLSYETEGQFRRNLDIDGEWVAVIEWKHEPVTSMVHLPDKMWHFYLEGVDHPTHKSLAKLQLYKWKELKDLKIDVLNALHDKPLSKKALKNNPEERFTVFNATDGIMACPHSMSKEDAEQFINDFRDRFKMQGYYKTASGQRIDPKEVELQIIREKPDLIPSEKPYVYCDRGAGDGEVFCWIETGQGEPTGDYAIIMDGNMYEVRNTNGETLMRTTSIQEAIKKLEELSPQLNPATLPSKERYVPKGKDWVQGPKPQKPSQSTISGEISPLKYQKIPPLVKKFMPPLQQKIVQANIEEFQDVLERLVQQITECPSTGETENIDDPMAYLHYFFGSADWYITEKDKEDEQHQAFGYADLGMGFPELGYISIEEIKSTPPVELDFHWKPIPLSKIKEKHEARANFRPNGFAYMGDIISGLANGIAGSISSHGANEFTKEELKVQREEKRKEKAEKKRLKKKRKSNPLDPISLTLLTGIVSGVTGVIVSGLLKDQLDKHNSRKNPEKPRIKPGDIVIFDDAYYEVLANAYISRPEHLVGGENAGAGYYLQLDPMDMGDSIDYADEPRGWVAESNVTLVESNPAGHKSKVNYSDLKKFPTQRLLSYMSFYERMLPQMTGSPYNEERKIANQYYNELNEIYAELTRRGHLKDYSPDLIKTSHKTNPEIAIKQYKKFQKMSPKNDNQNGKISDAKSPITVIGPIKHVVYHCSKWSGKEFENRENINVQYIHTWKKNRMDLCRDGNGDYFISGKCQIEPKGIDDWDKRVDWSKSKVDYPKASKNYAFLGILKEVAIVDGDTYTMQNALLCGRNNHLYIAYVSPEVYETIKKEYKLK